MVLDLASIQSNVIGQFILPFALLFAIVYGSLRTSKVFEGPQVNLIIAAVIAFIAALFSEVTAAIFQFMPLIIAILAALFFYNLIYTLLGGKKDEQGKKEQSGDVVFVVGALLVILALQGREFIPDLAGIDQTNLIFIFALLGIFVIWKRGSGASLKGQTPTD